MIWLTGSLMSVDEEWTGWGDVLLNPYLVLPYVVVSVALLGGAWALLRAE